MGGFLENLVRQAQQTAQQAANSINNNVIPLASNILSTVSGLNINIPSIVNNSANSVVNQIRNIINPIQGQLSNQIFGISGQITSNVNNIVGGLYGTINNLNGSVLGSTSNILNSVNNLSGTLLQNVSGIQSGIVSTLSGKLDNTTNTFNNALTVVRSNIAKEITDNANKIINSAGKQAIELSNKVNDIKGFIDTSGNAIKSALTTKINGLESNLLGKIANIGLDIDSLSRDFSNTLRQQTQNIAGQIISSVTSQFVGLQNIKTDIVNAINSQLTPIINLIKQLPNLGVMVGEQLIDLALDFLGDTTQGIGKEFLDWAKTNPGIITRLMNGEFKTFEELNNELRRVNITANVAGVLFLVVAFAASIIPVIMSFGSPIAEITTNFGRQHFTPSLMPSNEIITAYLKGSWTKEQASNEFKKLGYSTDKAEKILSNNQILLSVVDYLRFNRTGYINLPDLIAYLRDLGYDDEHIRLLTTTNVFIPPVSDLISMAVKEVFSPDIANKFGQFEDYPTAFDEYAKLQGIDTQWAKRYWAAHWNLPSPQMGFEMFQRGIIQEQDLILLLKSLDIMPYWREKLIQLNYNPLTRVDVRRMYGEGVLNESEVNRAYLDIGYSAENAKRLTEFTVKYETRQQNSVANESKTLTRALIEKAYSYGIYDRSKALAELKELGYSDSDSNLLLDIIDISTGVNNNVENIAKLREITHNRIIAGYSKFLIGRELAIAELKELGLDDNEANRELSSVDNLRDIEFKQSVIKQISELFLQNTIDENTAIRLFGTNGVNASESSQLLAQLTTLKGLQDTRPTLTQLQKFYSLGIIDVDTYTSELKGLGYNEKYVAWFIQMIEPQ